MAMETPPNGKSFWMLSFTTLATRGLLRDQTMRRRLMLGLLGAALLMSIGGSTVLKETLNWHEHPAWFIVFWIICAWLTVTAMLLGVFDILIVRKRKRAEARRLAEEFVHMQTRDR